MMLQSQSSHRFFFIIVFSVLSSSIGFKPAIAQTWQPPEPVAKERDWIKMNSGEWLWGDLTSLHDKDLEFDSEELDLLKLDWDDVAELRSARILTYRFEDAGVFSGTAVMRNSIIRIQTEAVVRELPREDLIIILEGPPKEINFWSAKATLGFVGRSGNTDQADLNTTVRVLRRAPRLQVDIKYAGNLGKVSSVETINNQNFQTVLDMLIKAGFFVTPASVNLFHDRFQNIDLKTTLSAGLGYFFLRGGDVDWKVNMQAGYVNTKFLSVQEGENDSEDDLAIIPSTALDWDITGDIEFHFDYNLQMAVPETRNAFHHASAVFSLDIWGDFLELDLSLTWDRVESPKPDADGIIPERDDIRTSIGIGVEL